MTINPKQLGEIVNAVIFAATQPLLSRKQLSSRYSVTADTIDEWRRAGILPSPHMLGRFPYWSLAEITRAESQPPLKRKLKHEKG